MPEKQFTDPCVYCQDAEALATVRNRRLCGDCFLSYANSKVFRRMEAYRGRKAPNERQRKLLLPLSFGLSSSVLLHVLNGQLERQLTSGQGRVAYELHVLVVEPSTISSNPSCEARFDLIQKCYPLHKYTMIPFHSIFEFDPEIKDTMRQFAGPDFVDDKIKSDHDRLETFRTSVLTATSKEDIDNILLSRLIVSCAKYYGCDGILWGDSDSRLAAKTLANVAKGRGAALTWQVCDGASPWDVQFSFPLRDLYTSELQLYVSLVPALEEIILPGQPLSDTLSNRNMSIDELMKQYIQTQGEKYPGVMANVVRTVNKLQPAPIQVNETRCAFCTAPLEILDGAPISDQFCYGCARSGPEWIYRGTR